MGEFDIGIIGGDRRTAYMIPAFEEMGYKIICYGVKQADARTRESKTCVKAHSLIEIVTSSKVIVGGIPFVKGGKICSEVQLLDLDETILMKNVSKEQKIFGGAIENPFMGFCQDKKIDCYDFMKEESIAVFNAVATAEGAILEALKNQETNLHKSKCLVLGFGRCGKVLSGKLKGLSAEVTVCSKCREELSYAEVYGMDTLYLNQLEDRIHEYEYIFNTIPAVVVRGNLLKNTRRNVLFIDIASGVGGVDYLAAKELGIHALHCMGLPGKYAAKISARKLSEYVVEKAFIGHENVC